MTISVTIRISGNRTSIQREQVRDDENQGLPVSTRALKKIYFFDPDDLVAGMEAGQTAAELQQLLGEKNMQLLVGKGVGSGPRRRARSQLWTVAPASLLSAEQESDTERTSCCFCSTWETVPNMLAFDSFGGQLEVSHWQVAT